MRYLAMFLMMFSLAVFTIGCSPDEGADSGDGGAAAGASDDNGDNAADDGSGEEGGEGEDATE